MSEPSPCDRFDRWLFEDGAEPQSPDWLAHLDGCDSCRVQLDAHRLLELGLGREPVPELSARFDAGLERKRRSALEIRPLSGWRKAAMLTYAFVAVGLLSWALVAVSLPEIDLTAPWVPFAAFFAVPLTLVLAIAASGWIPGGSGRAGQARPLVL